MIKETITFENLDGNTVTEDHYFHLSMKELTALELGPGVGLYDKLMAITSKGNNKETLEAFEEIIRLSYGQRIDGSASEFYKSPEISEKFMNSLAYDELFSSLLTSTTKTIAFINGIMPKALMSQPDVQQAMEKARSGDQSPAEILQNLQPMTDAAGPSESYVNAQTGLKKPQDEDGNLLPWALRTPTSKEQMRMTQAQLMDCMQRQSSGWKPPEALASELSGQ